MRHLQSLFIISESLHFQRKFKICKCQQCLLPTVNSPLPCNNSSPIGGGGYSSKVSVVLYNVCSTQLFKSCPVLFHTKMSFFAPIFWKKYMKKMWFSLHEALIQKPLCAVLEIRETFQLVYWQNSWVGALGKSKGNLWPATRKSNQFDRLWLINCLEDMIST